MRLLAVRTDHLPDRAVPSLTAWIVATTMLGFLNYRNADALPFALRLDGWQLTLLLTAADLIAIAGGVCLGSIVLWFALSLWRPPLAPRLTTLTYAIIPVHLALWLTLTLVR